MPPQQNPTPLHHHTTTPLTPPPLSLSPPLPISTTPPSPPTAAAAAFAVVSQRDPRPRGGDALVVSLSVLLWFPPTHEQELGFPAPGRRGL
ncbi:hypothetical protein DAI22_10g190300 [Oryza sativa Japonica Group]|nr:hypothetical protein DAI22_10g190300 [Oryza sativa Japonica Group]